MPLAPRLLPELEGFRFAEELHRGRHTVVLRGRRVRDNLPVVVKALNEATSAFEDAARLHHEQAMIAAIESDAVVRSHGLVARHRTVALLLEDFGGISLAEYLTDHRLDIPSFLRIAIQLCSALHDIHAAHVIHLDLNPSNIIINPETQQVKIADFGISTRLSSERVMTVHPNVLEGTLPYLSPEQTGRMNRAVDYRADFYALGITLYEALIGWVPFQSTDPMEILHGHIARTPTPPAELNPAIPRPVSDIVMRLLAKTAEDRYQSAAGLKADLEFCLHRWQADGAIPLFPLGSTDVSGRFQIPEALYGRDAQIATLLDLFERASEGAAALLLVTGDAGIGKSAFVAEVHKPIVRRRAYFVAGKFDQFKRDVPYLPLTQALRELVDQVLAGSADQIAQWRKGLQEALGPNGAVLSRVVPEIEIIIGPQPPLQDLPPKESQHRFTAVIQRFVRALATADHPLVLFLDDLQWADQASLDLLHALLADPALRHFLFIGASRTDGPPAAVHAVDQAFAIPGLPCDHVHLEPLDAEAVTDLVADTMRMSAEPCRPLALLVASKTGGNPFFIIEFLKALHHDGLLQFDAEERRWQWNLEEIRQRGITDNVVAMMTANIQQLPLKTQETLELASCIGNRFSLAALARVRKRTQAAVAAELWPAIREGLVLPLGDSYKYLQAEEETEPPLAPGVPVHFSEVTYRFAHDRVQQAAYSLIPADTATRVHYEIGRILLEHRTDADRQEDLFAAVNHLNLGSDHLASEEERQALIEINLAAARRAKGSAAFEPALRYLAAGHELVRPDDERAIPGVLRSLLMEKGECEYLTGNFTVADNTFDRALALVSSPADRGTIHALKIDLFIHQGKLDRALALALEALKILGTPMPARPGKLSVLGEMIAVRWRLGRRRIPDLLHLPVMTNQEPQMAMRILMRLFGLAYALSEEFSGLVIARMMNLTLRHGNADVSAFSYGLYGLLVRAGFRAPEAGRELAQLSLDLSAKFENLLLRGRCHFVYGTLHNHWYHHAPSNREYIHAAYRHAMENGDLLYASYALSQESIIDMATGVPLPTLYRNASAHLAYVRNIQHPDIALYFEAAMLWASGLMGGPPEGTDTAAADIEEATLVQHLESSTYAPPRMFYRFVRLQLCWFRRQYAEGLAIVEESRQLQHALIGQVVEAEYLFFSCLVALAVARDAASHQRHALLRRVSAGRRQLARWAIRSQDNFAHLADLLGAAHAAAGGDGDVALTLFERAIAGARKGGFVQHEGIAHLLAGEFFLERGSRRVAGTYLAEAHACFGAWGASWMVDRIEKEHGDLLPAPGAPGTTIGTRPTTATTRTGTQTLDLTSVLKASQALSGEILLPRLLERMMQIVLENAGAQRGLLIIEKANGLTIEAERAIDVPDAEILHSVPVEKAEHLSESIVRYVARVKESVVLDDAGAAGPFVADPYVLRTQPKSILCMPILHQGKMSGILYLENNLSAAAFTPARLEVLRLLSSQIAVSLENARLYAQERELARMQEEVRLAATIQRELLPSRPPHVEGYDIGGENIPVQDVGGDYFDFIRIDDRLLAVCIGDVSGKGLPASLLMANLQASLRGQSMVTVSPGECMRRSNRLLYESTSPEKFATVVYGILDTETHVFRYCNAGHEYPLVLSVDGSLRELSTGGIALGMLEAFPFAEDEVQLAPGDLLVMFSDGITEAMNPSTEQFGREHLARLLADHRGLALPDLMRTLVDAVKTHAAGAPQSDDMTFVAIRRGGATVAPAGPIAGAFEDPPRRESVPRGVARAAHNPR